MIIKSKCGNYDIIVDNDDYQKVIDFAPNGWEAKYTTGANRPYAITRKTIDGKRKQYYLHRLVMDLLDKPTLHIDHKNNNPLDNRKENLRTVTRSQNMKNRTSAKDSSSKYLGVSYCDYKKTKKYRTVIKDNIIGRIHLGYHYDEESAGYAYNLAAEIIHNDFANLNEINVKQVDNHDDIKEYVENALKKHKLI